MAANNVTASSVFSEARYGGRPIDQFRSKGDEWWLNVNYVETIDMKEALSLQSLRTTAAR